MIELVAFLGNHGREYQNNRHNAGWLLWERLHIKEMISLQKKFKSRFGSIDYQRVKNLLSVEEWQERSASLVGQPVAGLAFLSEHPERIHCMLPETYMNRSGDAVCQNDSSGRR